MKNVTTWAVWLCLCASLLAPAGCLDLDFESKWWGNDDADTAETDQLPDQQETPEQLTIRTQREQIDQLQAYKLLLEDDIVNLAAVINGLEDQVRARDFALAQQDDTESLDDAVTARDHYMELVDGLSVDNAELVEQARLLGEHNEALESLVATLDRQYEQLLNALAEVPATGDDVDEVADDADAADDAAGDSRIHFGG